MTRSKTNPQNMKLTLPVDESRDHIQGQSTAPVTLVEYGDYECPYCAQAYIIIKKVQERLGSKLRFVFRNFPVTKTRPHAYKARISREKPLLPKVSSGKCMTIFSNMVRQLQMIV